MNLAKFEIEYDFKPVLVGGKLKDELYILIGNNERNLVYERHDNFKPGDVTDPILDTYPITVFVKEVTNPTNTSPILFENLNRLNDSSNGKYAEIYCYFTALDGQGRTVKRRKTTVRVTAGGGGK